MTLDNDPLTLTGVVPVSGLEADRYLGTWYEIARLDHRFERDLKQVTATYERRPEMLRPVIGCERS